MEAANDFSNLSNFVWSSGNNTSSASSHSIKSIDARLKEKFRAAAKICPGKIKYFLCINI